MANLLMTRQPVPAEMARRLILAGRAPAGVQVSGSLDFSGCKELTRLPLSLKVRHLNLRNCTNLEDLHEVQEIRHLNLNGCPRLKRLPPGLRCYELRLQEPNLHSLPPDFQVEYR